MMIVFNEAYLQYIDSFVCGFVFQEWSMYL